MAPEEECKGWVKNDTVLEQDEDEDDEAEQKADPSCGC